MIFAYPAIAAFLLIGLPIGGWLLVRQERRRKTVLDDFGEPGLLARTSTLPPDRRRVTRHLLRLGALSLGVLAVARPQLGQRPASLATSGRDVLVLLDLSRSMNATDRTSTRLAVAKSAITEVLAASPEDRVGLIIFGGSAFLQLPLTADRAAFQRFLDAASTDDLADPGTDLANALATAATTFEHEGERGYQSVLVVSDGESGEGDVGPAIQRLRRVRVPVFAIGVGTVEGAPVPADSSEGPEKWHRDHIGRIVQSRLEEGDLRRAARETDGAYVRWTPGSGRGLGAELARAATRTISSRGPTERADRFQWPLGLAILMLAVQPLLGVKRRRPG